MMRNAQPFLPFAIPRIWQKSSIDQVEKLLEVQIYQDLRKHCFGGLALVMNRAQARGLTKIHPDSEKITQKILGVDFKLVSDCCFTF